MSRWRVRCWLAVWLGVVLSAPVPVPPWSEAYASPQAGAPERQVRPRSTPERRPTRAPRRTTTRPAATQPAVIEEGPEIPPEQETLEQAGRRLARRVSRGQADKADRALLAGVQFILAVGQPDASAAGGLLEAIGYQPLPLEGELPSQPSKPQLPADFQTWLGRQPPRPVRDIPLRSVQLLRRHELLEWFPAVAQWMLPDDFALLALPLDPAEALTGNTVGDTADAAAGAVAGWVGRPACLVVRVRGIRATIMGGNWFEALPAYRP